MYARHLFVVVGIFGDGSGPRHPVSGRSLGILLSDRIYAGVMNDALQTGSVSQAQAIGVPQLSVVIPTFNERDNVTTLFRRLEKTLAGIPFEAVFVDDNSPDGTADIAFALARNDPRIRCLRRVNRGGLAGAVIEGWLSSSADLEIGRAHV